MRLSPISFVSPQGENAKARPITKDAIFHYVYGVLHDPVYRQKDALNLKRDFPRLPFYPDFWAWAEWGQRLMALHIGNESVEPWPLARKDEKDAKARAAGVAPKPILKSDRDSGTIRIDSETTLSGIPPKAFDYRLGNRSGLDWILDQHKEKTPRDPTIREKFNTYRPAGPRHSCIGRNNGDRRSDEKRRALSPTAGVWIASLARIEKKRTDRCGAPFRWPEALVVSAHLGGLVTMSAASFPRAGPTGRQSRKTTLRMGSGGHALLAANIFGAISGCSLSIANDEHSDYAGNKPNRKRS